MIIPSKVLLFGEYTVLSGGEALGVPYERYTATWKQIEKYRYKEDLLSYLEWIKKQRIPYLTFDFAGAIKDVQEGWGIESQIPEGYGIGSSGAIVAALVKRYGKMDTIDLSEVQEVLGTIESYFHGKSSGFDPLISYLSKSVRVKGGNASIVEIPKEVPCSFSLFDSGIVRSGKDAILLFQEKVKQDASFNTVLAELKAHNDKAIEQYLSNDIDIKKTIRKLSKLQREHFDFLIPSVVKKQWDECLRNENKAMKLCGAGSGGYFIEFLFP